ncbi:hypothetical protein SMKC049_31270 [Serratia marcescens]|nr:hypothetical protein SMKC049_31270 [Serratia marcescens]
MKQIWFSVCLLTGSLLYSSIAPAQPTASGALLQQMSSASRSLNYELAYISISKQGIESLRYRHAVIGNVPLGQLLHMDGPRREVLQRGGGISYFEPGLEPFTRSHRRCAAGDRLCRFHPPGQVLRLHLRGQHPHRRSAV